MAPGLLGQTIERAGGYKSEWGSLQLTPRPCRQTVDNRIRLSSARLSVVRDDPPTALPVVVDLRRERVVVEGGGCPGWRTSQRIGYGCRRGQIDRGGVLMGWALVILALDLDDLAICLAAAGDVVAAEDLGDRRGGAPPEGLRSEHLDCDGDLLTRSGAANLSRAEALGRA